MKGIGMETRRQGGETVKKPVPLRLLSASLLVLSLCACGSLEAADWPQWRGPDRNDISKETGLLKKWPKQGPPLLWTYKNAGTGYSGPAIVGDRLYSMGARGDAEYVFALDLRDVQDGSPRELWAVKIGPAFTWDSNNWNRGPSATPSVDGDLLFALGGFGDFVCVETATGKEVWRKSMTKDLGGAVNNIGGSPETIGWGYAWSALVDGEQVICVPGGSQGMLAAFNKKTGDVIWRCKELPDQATYSSPIAAEVGGIRQYIQVANRGVAGVDARNGKLLWFYERKPAYNDVVIDTPIFHDNHVFITVGFSEGCDLIKLTPEGSAIKADKVYSNKNMVNRQGGAVLVGERLYGYSDNKGWVCLDFKTGKPLWMDRRKLNSDGSLTFADRHLYCYGDKDGTAVLLEPDAGQWKEDGRTKIPTESQLRKSSGKIWTHPVVANGRLYLRDQELLFCYDVKEHGQNGH
jgi:outer membrane protein assembly factor BamB